MARNDPRMFRPREIHDVYAPLLVLMCRTAQRSSGKVLVLEVPIMGDERGKTA